MADGTFLKVNFTALADAHADLGRGLDQLTTKLADLDRDARPLVNTWEGTAQTAYHTHQAAWTKSATELKTLLADIQRALHHSLHEYQDTENRNRNRFQS